MTSPQSLVIGVWVCDRCMFLTIKLKKLGMDMAMVVIQRKKACLFTSAPMAMWMCCRAKCEWKGCTSAFGDITSSRSRLNHIAQKKTIREVTEEGLRLEPLCDQRMNSTNRYLDQFCTDLLFQDKDTDKVFYGLDDIEGESDIIIVEGEMDKLSMEEAGFCNCVSVPNGAPTQVSTKDLPPEDKVWLT
ncbi:hypothetical protein Pint_11361 [Pistacia integerrima]|uniref:Uncharacterized protein n=1 Tax=Pistacia integerrima TaxID=434235 RepID=A0ACC0XN87_9ROSI|nr:hypothetical protein Pint_11361 [Pistacia integerrima]